METIAVYNHKGGSGKTSFSINFANYFREKGLKVLMVDGDSQANLSSQYEVTIDNSLYDLICKELPIESCMEKDLIHADESVTMIERIVGEPGYEHRLSNSLEKVSNEYDLSLIDLPPGKGVVLTSALLACKYVVIPTEATEFGYQGVEQTISYIERINSAYRTSIKVLGIFIVKYQPRIKEQLSIVEKIREKFSEYRLFSHCIPVSTKVDECQKNKIDLLKNYPTDNATIQYKGLFEEIYSLVDCNYSISKLWINMENVKKGQYDEVKCYIDSISLDELVHEQERLFNAAIDIDYQAIVKPYSNEFRCKVIMFYIGAFRQKFMHYSYVNTVMKDRYNILCDDDTFVLHCFNDKVRR